MKNEPDAVLLGRIVYWATVLGLAWLLILQPSRGRPRNGTAMWAGAAVLTVAVTNSIVRRWRNER